MSKKQQYLDRIVAHYAVIDAQMRSALAEQLQPIIETTLSMIGKEADASQVVAEFVDEFLPMSVRISRETWDQIYDEEQLAVIVDCFDRYQWWLPKQVEFTKLHTLRVNEQGGDIARRVLGRYEPCEDENDAI
jgi:hypothetical protein